MNNGQNIVVENAIEKLGAKFGELLSKLYTKIIVLEKINSDLTVQIQEINLNKDEFINHIEDLKSQLHQAQLDLIAAQGKAIIDKKEDEIVIDKKE
jgi:hypothetical protein